MTMVGFLVAIFLALIVRLYWIQVLPQEERVRAVGVQTQRTTDSESTPRLLFEQPYRGRILDRNGQSLAVSWYAHDFIVDGKEVVAVGKPDPKDREAVAKARALRAKAADHLVKIVLGALSDAGYTAREVRDVPKRLTRAIVERHSYGVLVRGMTPIEHRRVSERLRRALRRSVKPKDLPGMRLAGFRFVSRLRRTYPWGATTAQIIGVVGEAEDDEKGRIAGRTGFEAMADGVLAGSPGMLRWERDSRGHELLSKWHVQEPIRPGADVTLTIDAEIQGFCMEALEKSVKERKCARGSAVVLDARTGEILAAATWPTAAPELPEGHEARHLRSAAIQDVYEPGSIIKPVYLSWGLQNGDFSLSERWDCGGRSGYHVFRDGRRRRLVREYRANPGLLTTEEIIMKSSNVGAVRLLKDRMKLPRAWAAFERFGLDQFIPIAYPYVEQGRFTTPKQVRDDPSYNALNTACSFAQGYELTLTPVGMARMYLAFAGDGDIPEPTLIKEIRSGDRVEVPERRRRPVLNRETAHRMRRVLERVVEDGTAKVLKNDRWTVAAKTGTPKATGKAYYNPVICALAPASRPEIVVSVIHHEVRPKQTGGPYSGGKISGPVAKEIVERTLDYLQVPSDR